MRVPQIVAVLLAASLAAVPASAATLSLGPSLAVTKPDNPRLDRLFSLLKRESNEQAAARLARDIRRVWLDSGSATIDLLMQWSDDAIKARKYAEALDFLDQVVALAPDYAEGWNRRATVHFLMNDYAESMADIDRTLKLEPRNFGAIAGMAQILEKTGHKKLALKAYERVLAIYPMMRSAQSEVETLTQDLAGEEI